MFAPTGAVTAPLPSNTFTIEFWMSPGSITGAKTILALGGGAIGAGHPASLGEGLVIFLEDGNIKYRFTNTDGFTFSNTLGGYVEGVWQHVVFMASLRPGISDNAVVGFVNGVHIHEGFGQGTLDVGIGRFFLGHSPTKVDSSYVGLLDEFHVWSRLLSPAEILQVIATSVEGNEAGLIVDYRFDDGVLQTVADRSGHGWHGKLGTLFGGNGIIGNNPLVPPIDVLGPTGRPEWVVVTDSPVSALPRYQSPEDPDGVPKIEPVDPTSDPTSAITSDTWPAVAAPFDADRPYYHFVVGVDAPQSATGRFDFSRSAGIRVDGIDFFERAGESGPRRWELRASHDNFAAVLASDTTAPGGDYAHHVFLFDEPLEFNGTPFHPAEPIEFRLYGLDAPQAIGIPRDWTVDNFALIAGLVAAPTFNLPPTPPELVFVPSQPRGGTAPFDPTAGASDADGDPIAVSNVVVPANSGVLARNPDGRYVFTPAAGRTADVPLAFTLIDRWGATATANLTVTIPPPPASAPVAKNDSFDVAAGQALAVPAPGVLGNDSDADGDSLTASLVSTTRSGSLSFSPNGSFTYRPNAGFVGTDGFTYTARDPSGRTSGATVSISVEQTPNRPPVAANDSIVVSEDGLATRTPGNLLANDSDPERGPLAIVAVGTAAHGTVTAVRDGFLGVTGNIISVRYRPAANYFGPDAFTYTIADAGGLRATATVNVTVTPVNDAPIGGDDTFVMQLDGDTQTADTKIVPAPGVLSNDSDLEGSSLEAVLETLPSNGTLTSFNVDGSFTYESDGTAGPDFFTYRAVDASGAQSAPITVEIIVLPHVVLLELPPDLPPVIDGGGGFGGIVVDVDTVNGYIADGLVFFDANLNATWDSAEPRATTEADGAATLIVPSAYDRNRNGLLEPAEGVLVSLGGVIGGTTQPATLPLRATLGARVITPLTSLITSLVLDAPTTATKAQARVLAALDLPAFELLGDDPIAETIAGTTGAAEVLRAHKMVASAYGQIARFLAGATKLSDAPIGLAVMSALAERMAPAGATLALDDSAVVASVIRSAALRLGETLPESAVSAAATVVAAAAEALAETPSSADIAYVAALTRIESAAQGPVAALLEALGAGRESPASVVAQATGAALHNLIDGAPLGLLTPATAAANLANLYASPANEGGEATLFGSIVGGNPQAARTLLVNWGDGLIGRVDLAAGETTFRFDHAYVDDAPSGTSSDATPIGVVLVVDGDAVDAASVVVQVDNLVPILGEIAYTPVVAAGGAARLAAEVFDVGAGDELTFSVDWGDGYSASASASPHAQQLTAEHVFATPGTYEIVVTLQDDDGGSASRTLTIDVSPSTAPVVQAVHVGDGSAQRSMIRQLTVVFDQPVTWNVAAATLVRQGGAAYELAAENPSGDGRTFVVEFLGANLIGGSLPDGIHQLTIPAASVTGALGSHPQADVTAAFHRFLGDADGDGDVDQPDRKAFLKAFGSTQFEPSYDAAFDINSDGLVNLVDDAAIFPNYGQAILASAIVDLGGDPNRDGWVNRIDAAIFAANFGRASGATLVTGDFDGDGDGDADADVRDLAVLSRRWDGPAAFARPGDADRDGVVDLRDLAAVAANLGKAVDAVWSDGDFNGDGRVGLGDLLILRANLAEADATPAMSAAAAIAASRRKPSAPALRARREALDYVLATTGHSAREQRSSGDRQAVNELFARRPQACRTVFRPATAR